MRLLGLQGNKTVLGGVMVIRKGSKGVQYMFVEKAPGDQPPLDTVRACSMLPSIRVIAGHASIYMLQAARACGH